ncbi:MAG: inositol-3-phosphate synthase [Promethearchaeota archaeon]|nr:MAG: inositol-3-phosphate synthase [Candidatus Lokiarchaeota archaeon]
MSRFTTGVRDKMGKIKVAIAGVGNCCSALVQGVEYLKDGGTEPLGLIYENVGEYIASDIDFVAAFDVIEGKVGKDLATAIHTSPNNMYSLGELSSLGVIVQKGELLDGISEYLKNSVKIDPTPPVNVVDALKAADAEILINLTPSGATETSKWYAEQALQAGCAYINATPTPMASDPDWDKKFKGAGIPIAGDDLQNQIGSTIIHKNLLKMLVDRGIIIKESYCLDVGGGPESLNALHRARDIKRQFKTNAVKSQVHYDVPIVAGSTDFVPFLNTNRTSYFWILGKHYANSAELRIDLQLSTTDAPNGVAILLDVIRGVKIALNRKISGALESISAYGFKRPPKPTTIQEATNWIEDFISERRDI